MLFFSVSMLQNEIFFCYYFNKGCFGKNVVWALRRQRASLLGLELKTPALKDEICIHEKWSGNWFDKPYNGILSIPIDIVIHPNTRQRQWHHLSSAKTQELPCRLSSSVGAAQCRSAQGWHFLYFSADFLRNSRWQGKFSRFIVMQYTLYLTDALLSKC